MEFLKSTRFWVMIAGALSIYLASKGLIGKEEMQLFATIATGFVGVRTLDRFGEQVSAMPVITGTDTVK